MSRFISESSIARWVSSSIDCLPPVISDNVELIKDADNSENSNFRYFVTRNSDWNLKALSCIKDIRILKDKTTDLLFYGLDNGIHENNDIYHYMEDNSLIFDF